MIESLVIFLREGSEIALVLGIVLSVLNKTGQSHFNKFIYSGLIFAILVSLLSGIGLWIFGLNAENDMVEGIIYIITAFLISTMVIWMTRSGKRLKEKIEGKVSDILSQRRKVFQVGTGLFLFTSFIVLREGVETVFFTTAFIASFKGNPVLVLTGSIAGIILAFGFGILLTRGSIRVPLKGFFRITGIVLLFLSLKFFALGIHELSETGILPTTDWWMRVIGFLSKDSTTTYSLILLLIIPSLYLFIHSFYNKSYIPSKKIGKVERRKIIAQIRSARSWSLTLLIFSLTVSIFLAIPLFTSQKGYDPPPAEIKDKEGIIEINTSEIVKFKKFIYRDKDKIVRFFVLKEDSLVYVALDDCAICPPLGYYLLEDNLICKNCDAPIAIETVGQSGGCNPIPFLYKVIENKTVILTEDLTK